MSKVNPNDTVFYVYVYLDPYKPGNYVYDKYVFTYEPFYVGEGHGNRAYDHIRYGARNKDFYKRIKEIQEPLIVFQKTDLQQNVAFNLERIMITSIGRQNNGTGPLYNKTNGGQGNVGAILSEEHKKKIGEANRNRIWSESSRQKISESSKNRSDKTKQKMSKSQKGRKHSEETKQKISKSQKGKFVSEKTKQKIREKRKLQVFSEESRRKMSLAQKRRYNS